MKAVWVSWNIWTIIERSVSSMLSLFVTLNWLKKYQCNMIRYHVQNIGCRQCHIWNKQKLRASTHLSLNSSIHIHNYAIILQLIARRHFDVRRTNDAYWSTATSKKVHGQNDHFWWNHKYVLHWKLVCDIILIIVIYCIYFPAVAEIWRTSYKHEFEFWTMSA